jgi:hypothetical protein
LLKKADDERLAKEKQQAKQTADSLAGKTAGELEAAQVVAFQAYQAKSAELAAKKTGTVTTAEKVALEKLRREWEATRTAKADIVKTSLLKKLWDARTKSGMTGLRNVIDDASRVQLALAKKNREFPNDIKTANELGAAETQILLLRDSLIQMAKDT